MAYFNFQDYQEQLKSPEWNSLRDVIFSRDDNHCQMCGKGKSERILFDKTEFNIGIDYSKEKIKGIRSYVNSASKKKISGKRLEGGSQLKLGYLHGIDNLSLLSNNGHFYYTVWHNKEDFFKNKETGNLYLIEFLCDDGCMARIIYSKESDFDNLILPRVYISKHSVTLNVHHKKYISGHKAWEYDREDLITLCQECHFETHKQTPVQVYEERDGHLQELSLTPCYRCHGMGYFPEYKYIQNGECFRCHGRRYEQWIEDKTETVELEGLD